MIISKQNSDVVVKPVKSKSITFLMNEDAISFYKKSKGKEYKTFMNEVLKASAESHKKLLSS